MAVKVLFIVMTDPRTSARPAEAIRIAAGVGTWRKAEVKVYLHGPAILMLGEYVDELVDEENYRRYLPIISEFAAPILIQAGTPFGKELGEAAASFRETSDQDLALLATEQNCVLRF